MNGKALLSQVVLGDLDVSDMIDVLAELFVQDNLLEKEFAEARDKTRNQIVRAFNGEDMGYDDYEDYGSRNDASNTPLPPLTEQTPDGYMGLDAPLS